MEITSTTPDSGRLSTGVEQLDAILDGGIPQYSVVLVTGLPGTGKSVLSLQTAFANARAGGTTLHLSTLSEPPIKMLGFSRSFRFFDPTLFGTRMIYAELGDALQAEGAAGVIKVVDRMLREHRPNLVIIDSFKVLREAITDTGAFRRFVLDLVLRLAAWEATTLFVGEYGAQDLRDGPEFAIVDGIIHLYGTEEIEQQRRYLRVMKMRGTSTFGGEHFFEITEAGMTVYPRMRSQVVGEYAPPGEQRVRSAITGMDNLLGGGLLTSTVTLISGPTGSGKSLLALSFLIDSARRGERSLLVSLEESPGQLRRNVRAFDWDLVGQGLLDIMHISPSELNLDRHAYEIKERAAAHRAKHVVIDSITALNAAVPEPGKHQSYLWAITDYFKRKGVTLIMTNEAADPFEALVISARGMSFVVDNIIFLRYVEVLGEIKRAVGILKARGSRHTRFIHELIIDPPALAVGSRLDYRGMLGGAQGERTIKE